MADGQHMESSYARRPGFLWTEIFRLYWIALDPRKLLIAAAGILAVSIGWWFLSICTFAMASKPERDAVRFSEEAVAISLGKKADGTEYNLEVLKAEGTKRYNAELAKWSTLNDLAGPNGRMSTMPWSEYRGENPYLFATKMVDGTSVERGDAIAEFTRTQVPVLLEPLVKLLLPIVKITGPNTTFGTRVYCLLCLIWSLLVWAFCGGVITRITAVQLSGKDRISLTQAIQYVMKRYVSYIMSPVLPLIVIAVIVLALIVFGLLGLIPLIGDVLILGILYPLVILAGLVMAVVLVGLVGYPLMYSTLSVEGSDTFDALSRTYNYVYQAPWRFIWYSTVAIVYGMAITFFVIFLGSLTVYLGKWGVNQSASAIWSTHTPDYLYISAPKTLGWRELMLKGSDIEQVSVKVEEDGRKRMELKDLHVVEAKKYRESYYWYHHLASWIVTFWLTLLLLMLLGFGYSYFWSAATTIYLLMRKAVDDTELDEVYIEEETNDQPGPNSPHINIPPPPSSGTSLPMVPAGSTAAPAPSAPPPTVPFTGPVGAIKPAEAPKTDAPKPDAPKPDAPKTDGPKT